MITAVKMPAQTFFGNFGIFLKVNYLFFKAKNSWFFGISVVRNTNEIQLLRLKNCFKVKF